jgi:enoyl-[acyl-carrier protein] reductase/trans-2-enoyl-CoA reductase (NAD+)
MIIRMRGFICLTAHPDGCDKKTKKIKLKYVQSKGAIAGGKKVLVIGFQLVLD